MNKKKRTKASTKENKNRFAKQKNYVATGVHFVYAIFL